MRITQIMLAKGFGGAERSFVDTAIALAERGHTVQAICHEDFSELALLPGHGGIRVDAIRAGGEWDFLAPRRIAALLRDFKSEIVHTQLKRAAWHGGRAAKLAGIPSVAKLHNYVDLKRYRHMTLLLCTTGDQVSHVRSQGWDGNRVRWVPNFSRIEAVECGAQSFCRPFRILSYGRYVKKKGFEHLIEAAGILWDRGIEVRLRIGGSGEEHGRMLEKVQGLGLSDAVELGFWIDDVAAVLDWSDVFVLPSLDEPFGIVMLEAMARAVPIVTTKTKGPSEVLSTDTAALVDIGSAEQIADAIQAIYEDFSEASVRAEKALDLYASSYSADAVLPQIETAYADAIEIWNRSHA